MPFHLSPPKKVKVKLLFTVLFCKLTYLTYIICQFEQINLQNDLQKKLKLETSILV